MDEIHSNVFEAGAIAIQLGYTQEGHQEDMMESREESEEAPPPPPS